MLNLNVTSPCKLGGLTQARDVTAYSRRKSVKTDTQDKA
jgi:hypothetical protein